MVEHRLAKLAAAATFVLLLIGGTVNATGSSLACPEPTLLCHGSILPPMTGGVLYEHGHRLAAMTCGLLQIALSVMLLLERRKLWCLLLIFTPRRLAREIRASRSKDKKLGLLLLAMIVAQGTFGAITVGLKLKWYVSTTHLALGMSYFAMLIYTVFRTRRPASVVELDRHARQRVELGSARTWIGVACGFVMMQVVLGGLVRHLGAALVCIGMPACTPTGDWFPDSAIQDLHMIHRGFGCITAVVTTIAAIQVYRRARSWSGLRLLALLAPLLVAGQIALGVFTVLTMREVPVAVAHFAGAMSLWALWMSAWLMTGDRVPAPRIPRARAIGRVPVPA